MNKRAFIKAIEYYLPSATLTNSQIAERFPEWDAEKIASKVGIASRHISAPEETSADLAYNAAQRLLSRLPDHREKIDFILLCSQSVDYKLPSTACLLQNKLGLSVECGAFDFNLGCSGYEYGLAVAKGLIAADIAHNVLLITAETYSKYIHPKDKGNITIFGDAASATLISNDDGGIAEIGNFVLGSDGSGADTLIVRTGGARHPLATGKSSTDSNGNIIRDDYLYMNGAAIFNFAADVVDKMVSDLLKKEHKTIDDIDLWIFHQANKYMINYLRKAIGISKDKFFTFMEQVGNTVSNTIPIALCEAMKQDKLHGEIVLAGFGVGLSWGATILHCK